jgi:hypothetical protein
MNTLTVTGGEPILIREKAAPGTPDTGMLSMWAERSGAITTLKVKNDQGSTDTVAIAGRAGYSLVDATNDVGTTVTAGRHQRITKCGDGKKVTVATTAAVAGDTINFSRPAIGASSSTVIVNGGSGAGTLATLTANKLAAAEIVFDGTDWQLGLLYQQP